MMVRPPLDGSQYLSHVVMVVCWWWVFSLPKQPYVYEKGPDGPTISRKDSAKEYSKM